MIRRALFFCVLFRQIAARVEYIDQSDWCKRRGNLSRPRVEVTVARPNRSKQWQKSRNMMSLSADHANDSWSKNRIIIFSPSSTGTPNKNSQFENFSPKDDYYDSKSKKNWIRRKISYEKNCWGFLLSGKLLYRKKRRLDNDLLVMSPASASCFLPGVRVHNDNDYVKFSDLSAKNQNVNA